EDDEGRCLAGAQRLEKIILKDHLGVAAVFEAADEIGATDVLAVDIEAKAIGKQDTKRRQNTKNAGLVVSRLENNNRKAEFRTLCSDHVLDQRALFRLCASGRVTENGPCAVLRFELAALLRAGRSRLRLRSRCLLWGL